MCCEERSLWRNISKNLHSAHNENKNNSCYFIALHGKSCVWLDKRCAELARDLTEHSQTEITLVILLRVIWSHTQSKLRVTSSHTQFFFLWKGPFKRDLWNRNSNYWFSGHVVTNIVRRIALSGTFCIWTSLVNSETFCHLSGLKIDSETLIFITSGYKMLLLPKFYAALIMACWGNVAFTWILR